MPVIDPSPSDLSQSDLSDEKIRGAIEEVALWALDEVNALEARIVLLESEAWDRTERRKRWEERIRRFAWAAIVSWTVSLLSHFLPFGH